jgi:ketosteroid isomerase-like protein
MNHTNRSIALAWFEAFNAHNLDQLLHLYHDDAEHYSPKLKLRHPETKGLIKGKEALRTWWQDAFDHLPTLRYELQSLTANDDRVFMEYRRHVKGEEDIKVAEVLEIRDKKIKASRVYHG